MLTGVTSLGDRSGRFARPLPRRHGFAAAQWAVAKNIRHWERIAAGAEPAGDGERRGLREGEERPLRVAR